MLPAVTRKSQPGAKIALRYRRVDGARAHLVVTRSHRQTYTIAQELPLAWTPKPDNFNQETKRGQKSHQG